MKKLICISFLGICLSFSGVYVGKTIHATALHNDTVSSKLESSYTNVYKTTDDFYVVSAEVDNCILYGVIDSNANEVIPCAYRNLFDSSYKAIMSSNEIQLDSSKNELIFAEKFVGDDILCGFIDITNKEVIPFKYHEANRFINDIACVGIEDENYEMKYGYINKNGDEKISLIYNDATDFNGDIASVKKENLCGVINKDGDTVVQFIYDDIKKPFNNLIPVKKGNKWGVINRLPRKLKKYSIFYKKMLL